MSIGDNIRAAREAKNISLRELARRLKVAASTVSGWENGSTKPDVDRIEQLINVLGVTANYLFDSPELSVDEYIIVEKLRNLSEWEKNLLESVLNQLIDHHEDEVEVRGVGMPSFLNLPYFGHTSAGLGQLLLRDETEETVRVKDSRLAGRADFVLEVEGDSMEPKFYEGDLLLVKRQPLVEDGEIGIFMVDGKSYVKEKRGNCLRSLNPKYNDIPLSEDALCFGKVLGKAEI